MLADEVAKIWLLYDSDDNGVLTFDEMCRFVREMTEDSVDPKILTVENMKAIFSEFDENGDGHVDQCEMLRFLKAVTGL